MSPASLRDNESDLLVPRPGDASHADRFVDLVNEAAHYAEFGSDPRASADAGFRPDFACATSGHRLEPTLPAKDRLWWWTR